MNAKAMLVGLAIVITLTPLGAVSGQDWSYGSPYSSAGWGFGWPASFYAADTLPYFSLYPPVYYSYRVPWTYGYSPFAYPSGVLTPSSEPPRAAVGQNPVAQQRRPPLRISNPFVEVPAAPAVTMHGNPPARQPKIVYPAAMARRGGNSGV